MPDVIAEYNRALERALGEADQLLVARWYDRCKRQNSNILAQFRRTDFATIGKMLQAASQRIEPMWVSVNHPCLHFIFLRQREVVNQVSLTDLGYIHTDQGFNLTLRHVLQLQAWLSKHAIPLAAT